MKVSLILTRFYVNDLDSAIKFYEKLLNEKCKLRFKYTEANLELAQVGTILLLCGSDEAIKPFIDTKATFLVDSIIEFRDSLLKSGAKIIRDIKEVPTGFNFTARHLDGTIVEYVQFKVSM